MLCIESQPDTQMNGARIRRTRGSSNHVWTGQDDVQSYNMLKQIEQGYDAQEEAATTFGLAKTMHLVRIVTV